jgi:hypothetical protein
MFGPGYSVSLCCSVYCLCVCTVLLPPGVNPVAVNKYVVFIYRNVFVNNSFTQYNEVVKSYVLLCNWKARRTNVQTRSSKIF